MAPLQPIVIDEDTAANMFVAYGWRLLHPQWSPAPPALMFRFATWAPVDSEPVPLPACAVPPQAWRALKLNHGPTDWCTLQTDEILKQAAKHLLWPKLLKLSVFINGLGSRAHLVHLKRVVSKARFQAGDLWRVDGPFAAKYSVAHRATASKKLAARKRLLTGRTRRLRAVLPTASGRGGGPKHVTLLRLAKACGPFLGRNLVATLRRAGICSAVVDTRKAPLKLELTGPGCRRGLFLLQEFNGLGFRSGPFGISGAADPGHLQFFSNWLLRARNGLAQQVMRWSTKRPKLAGALRAAEKYFKEDPEFMLGELARMACAICGSHTSKTASFQWPAVYRRGNTGSAEDDEDDWDEGDASDGPSTDSE